MPIKSSVFASICGCVVYCPSSYCYEVNVSLDELRRMHIGQGAELSWTFNNSQPTEEEYTDMVDNSERTLL
jgi:hypothetical protein